MARKITIPITDHEDVGICALSYTVAYKRTGDISWVTNAYSEPPFEITNLEDDIEYLFRVTRHCCDGIDSAPLELTVNTTILAAPANFIATPADSEVALDWDVVTGAGSYTLERADDDAFATNLTSVYTGTTTNYTDVELTNGTIYYYRVKATATNHADGAYATTNATPTAS